MATRKRKLWSDESMAAAMQSVQEGKGLREAVRLYNVPVESLRRRILGTVSIDCWPGPPTILTTEEEDRLCEYVIEKADIGFGLISCKSLTVLWGKNHRKHPFHDGMAGRGWFEGFKARHPTLTIRTPQPLSYSRALCSNKSTIEDFFCQIGSFLWEDEFDVKTNASV